MALLPSIPVLRATLPRLNLQQKVWSPYGPRPRRSPRVVKAWIGALVLVGILIFWLHSRHRDTTRDYATLLVHGRRRGGGPVEGAGAGAGAGAGVGSAAGVGAGAAGG